MFRTSKLPGNYSNTRTTLGYPHLDDESARQVPKQLSEYFALGGHYARAEKGIVMPNDAKSQNKSPAAESQGFRIQ